MFPGPQALHCTVMLEPFSKITRTILLNFHHRKVVLADNMASLLDVVRWLADTWYKVQTREQNQKQSAYCPVNEAELNETAPWKSSYPWKCCPQFVPIANRIPQSCTELGIGFSWFGSTHRQRQKPTETPQGWGLLFIVRQSLNEETFLTIILWRVFERCQWWQFKVAKFKQSYDNHNTADFNLKIYEWSKSP